MGFVGFEGTKLEDSSIKRDAEQKRAHIPAPPHHEATEKTGDCEPTKPSKPVHAAQSESPSERPFYSFRTRDDPYGRRAHAALDAICATQAPEGLIVWLDEHSPSLYNRLTRDLPDEISRAWNARIPQEKFDTLCAGLVETYQRAAELYRSSKRSANLFEQHEFKEGERGPEHE